VRVCTRGKRHASRLCVPTSPGFDSESARGSRLRRYPGCFNGAMNPRRRSTTCGDPFANGVGRVESPRSRGGHNALQCGERRRSNTGRRTNLPWRTRPRPSPTSRHPHEHRDHAARTRLRCAVHRGEGGAAGRRPMLCQRYIESDADPAYRAELTPGVLRHSAEQGEALDDEAIAPHGRRHDLDAILTCGEPTKRAKDPHGMPAAARKPGSHS